MQHSLAGDTWMTKRIEMPNIPFQEWWCALDAEQSRKIF
jgi:hypothetical protein